MKETLKQAGYSHVATLGHGQHVLADDTGKLELWVCHKGHASYGLKYKNTHLEFATSKVPDTDAVWRWRMAYVRPICHNFIRWS